MKSYEAFDSRLALLETARFQDFDNDYVVSGCAYIYEQVFGISITLLKRLLEYEGATLAASGVSSCHLEGVLPILRLY